mmetsp:Transcript_107791/g.310432  ORF Transcript_107791/g.310432 Transcript_107791/m.310432 type:complete len:279 (+) Transcript_107791:125-961(+)
MAELSVQLSSLSHLALLTCLQAECWGEDVVPDEASDTEAACGFEPSCGPTREEGHTEKPRDLEQVGGQAHGCEAEADEPRKALGPRRLPVHMQPQRVRDEVACDAIWREGCKSEHRAGKELEGHEREDDRHEIYVPESLEEVLQNDGPTRQVQQAGADANRLLVHELVLAACGNLVAHVEERALAEQTISQRHLRLGARRQRRGRCKRCRDHALGGVEEFLQCGLPHVVQSLDLEAHVQLNDSSGHAVEQHHMGDRRDAPCLTENGLHDLRGVPSQGG